MLSNLPKLNKFIDERNEFSLKTFGHPKEHNFKLPLNKLREELEELLKNPDDNLEWADCLICFLDAAWRKGYSFEDLLDFAIQKLDINKKRKWQKRNDGIYQHI